MDCMARLCTSFNLLSEPCARPCKLQSYLITLSVFLTAFCSVGGKRETCPTERSWKCRKESSDAVSEWMNFFFILLSWAWIMEHHEPYQAFWRVGFYVSYQVERPEAQCHAVFLCRAHSLSANLCHPHIFLIRRDQDQLISHTKFPAQLLEQHPSTSERLSEHISSKWPFNVKKKPGAFRGKQIIETKFILLWWFGLHSA